MKILVTAPIFDDADKKLQAVVPEAEFSYITDGQYAIEDLKDKDIIIGNIKPDEVKYAENLKFLHLNSAGADAFCKPGIIPEGVKFCCATGTYGVGIAEHMIGMILSFQKKLRLYDANQKKHVWQSEGRVKGIIGTTTLVVGAGDLGGEFGKRMNALGSKVIGIRRNPFSPEDYMSDCGTLDDLDRFLPQADYVACTLPNTPETIKLFDRHKFELMKEDALFINTGRGSLVDSHLLAEVLDEGLIAGACVDVTDVEPLPEDHPLWDQPNCIITPHVSGGFHLQYTYDSLIRLVTYNLEAFLNEKPLKSEMDITTGYRKK